MSFGSTGGFGGFGQANNQNSGFGGFGSGNNTTSGQFQSRCPTHPHPRPCFRPHADIDALDSGFGSNTSGGFGANNTTGTSSSGGLFGGGGFGANSTTCKLHWATNVYCSSLTTPSWLRDELFKQRIRYPQARDIRQCRSCYRRWFIRLQQPVVILHCDPRLRWFRGQQQQYIVRLRRLRRYVR